jgi:hypothetical protein
VATLYEVLGASPDASDAELRRAYYLAARQLHPDLNPDSGTDAAMRALNQAWAVLGNPERRKRYDAQISLAPPRPAVTRPPAPPVFHPDDDEPAGAGHRPGRLLRPSVVVVAILAIIFVVTAYAGPSNHQPRSTLPTSSTASTLPSQPVAGDGANTVVNPDGSGSGPLVGKCILRLLGYDAFVVCNQPGAQTIEAEVAKSADCPPGTTVYQLEGHSQLVCLTPSES